MARLLLLRFGTAFDSSLRRRAGRLLGAGWARLLLTLLAIRVALRVARLPLVADRVLVTGLPAVILLEAVAPGPVLVTGPVAMIASARGSIGGADQHDQHGDQRDDGRTPTAHAAHRGHPAPPLSMTAFSCQTPP